MASPPPLDHTPFQRRLSFAKHPYIPLTPSPLSPHSASTSGTTTPIATLPLNSHYYRPPRSTLTSPTRSVISSTAGSPTRTTRQTRIQSLLANDPLLSRLTTVTISRLSNDPDFAFSPAERDWSLRAAEGIVKVGEWLREVEAWNKEWRRNGRAPGVGYLPPNLDRPKKRRKVGLEAKAEMGSIVEETEEELGGRSRPLRRRLVWDTSDSEEDGRALNKKSAAEGTSGRQPRKPPTPSQLKLQKQKAEANGEGVPDKSDRPIHEEYDGESTDEDEEGVEYWGSLRKATIEHCLARVELIKSEIEELDVEALKTRVLAYRTNPLTGITNPLTDSSAIITAITLQLLPPLHRLTKLLSIWAVRLAVLRIVPVFLRWLQIAGDALDAGYGAINHPSISPDRFSSQDSTSWRGLEEETFTLMQETITQKVATAGKLMDTMLDALEGREDVLPDVWITELEDVEERVGAWEMDGERVVLEGRLRLEELRQRESRREEQGRERERARLILEQERFAEEARGAESVVESVMEHAEETERGLREALEVNEDVVEGIELGDEDTEGSGDEDAVPGEISELLMRLEGIEKERLFSREASDSDTEDEDGLFDPNSRRGMGMPWGSYADALPGQHRALKPRHGLSLGSFTQPDLDSGSTTFHTPMQTPFIPQGDNDRKPSSTATEFYTPMPTPGMQQESPPSRPGSTTPTQFHTPMPTPLILPSQPQRRHSTTPFYTPMPTPLMPAFQQGPPVLRRQPSMPCMPVPKLPPTAQIFTTTVRREPPSPETPKRASTEVKKDVKKTSPIFAAARYFFKMEKEETKKERAKREEREREEEARRKEEEEREMIAVVDAETERLAKLEEAEKERAAKVKVVREKLAEAEKLREKERAAREIEEKRKVAEAERKRLVEEEERRKKAELEAARVKAEEEERLRLEEAKRHKAELERTAALEAEEKRKAAEAAALEAARLKAEEEERQRIAEEERIAEAKEEAERQRQASLERLAALEAARVKAEEEAEAQRKRLAEEEAERLAALEAARVKAEEAEAQQKRLAEEEAERLAALEASRLAAEAERQRLAEEAGRQRQAEIERLAAIEAAKLKAEAERLRLIEEEEERKRQVEAERIAAIALACLAAEEEQRRQAEVERLAALEAARLMAEAERLRLIGEEAERQRQVEIERLAAIEAARVKAEEEERVRLVEEEAERQRQVEAERVAALEVARLKAEAEVEAEHIRVIEEESARIKAEAEAEAEAECRRLAEEEVEQLKAELERLAIEAERQRTLEIARAAEVERQRLVEEEAEKKRQADAQHLAALEAARIRAEAEDDRRRAIEEEARRNAEAHAEAIRCAEEEVARQLRAEFERLAATEAARIRQEEVERQYIAELEAERLRAIEQEAENERRIALEVERLKVIEQETEKQRHAALETARLEAEEEAERLRILEQERKVEAERQQEEQRIAEAEAQKAENERLAALEEEAAERLRAIEDEEIHKRIAEQEAKWLEEDSETERLREIEEEQIRRRISEQEARWEAEEEEDRRMVGRLRREAMEADAEAERRQERFDSEDGAELRVIARIKKAALEAGAELYRQQVIEGKEQRRRIAAYEAGREAEQAEENRIAGEIERQRVREIQEEQRWEAEEQAERERISTDIAEFEAANAEDERQQAIQEKEIQQRFAETEEKAESDMTFEELDRRRRLAEDERQRLADLALVEREQKRLAAQEAERLRMEKQIEDTRLEAERLREQEEKRRQAQSPNHQGSNSEGDFISGDDITEDYQDVSPLVQSLPLNEADEDSESENIYAEARKHQSSVPPPSVSMTPITSRSSSVLDEMKYTTPKTTKGVSSIPPYTPWSPEESGLGITPGALKSQDDSEASSDMDALVAAENLAAHNSLQQALNDSIEYELPRNMQSPDRDTSGDSFNGMPSIFVASSTPQHHSDTDDSRDIPKTTIWDHAAHSPVFDEDDSPSNSSTDGPFPSDLNTDESSYPQLSVEDYEQEDCSDSDMVPLTTSTPKTKRRPNMLGGLDSITEVLTPRSPQDGFFRPPDDNVFGTPSKKSGKSGNLMLPGGFSSQDSPTSRRRSFNDRKVTPISSNLSSLQNKLAVKRGTTPEPKAPIKAQRSQKSTRKAPLDMARPRSLSSNGNYISPGSTTTKSAPKSASTLGPAIKAIRRPHMEIDSDDEGSVISEQRWSRPKENTPDFHSSPTTPNLGPVPRLNVNKRNTKKPSNLNTQAMADKSKRLYQPKRLHDEESSVSSQGAPQTPRLEFPQASLDDKVNEILASLPSPVRLTASNLQKLSEASNKRQPPLRPFELTSPTGIPAPKSVGSSSMVSDAPSSFARGGRKHNPSTPGDIKLYHLHRNDGQAPIKLYIRLVGERGERVMVRVGGGWADLAEYLKEYATHHASKRRTVSGGGIEIQDLSGPHHHTLHPSRSISSLRSNSPAPGNSRSNSPSPGDHSRSNSALGNRPGSSMGNRSASSMGNRPASSMGNRPGSSMGVRGRERSSSLVRSPPLTTPPAVMRGGHNGTGKERSNLTPFQPLAYQRPSGLSPPGPPPSGSRPPSRGQGASRPPSRGQGANRPPSRPGSSHSTVGGIRRSASRLSFTESIFDPSEAGGPASLLPKPLGLAGPKGKKTAISPEGQAWVEGMMGEVLKASKGRRLTGGSNNGDIGLGDEPSIVPGEMEVQSGTTRRLFLKMG